MVAEGGGALVPPQDSGAAAEAIIELLDDPKLVEAQGRRAWKHVAQRFTIQAMVSGHLQALREACGSAGAP